MTTVTALHSLHSIYDGGVYAIVAPMNNGQSVVKIGRTVEPLARFSQLLPGIPFPCKMYYLSVGYTINAAAVETRLHREFKDRRTRGEWFLFNDEDGPLLMEALKAEHKRLRPSVKFKLREITVDMVRERQNDVAKQCRAGY